MFKLSAFADEISPELSEQIAGCKSNGITHIELRAVWGKNVLDLDAAQRQKIKADLKAVGMGVICIGSPIGKVKINEPFDAHFDRFKIAVDAAEFFDAPFIRIFSYYPPQAGQSMEPFREEVIRRMKMKVAYIKGRPITLVHENEKDIYGEKLAGCLDLMKSVNSPQFRTAFDFANFVQAKEHPLDNWPALKPYTVHVHVKDAAMSDGHIVPAGEGDGQIAPILKDLAASGYDGYLTLEPHLAAAGQFSGFSGPKLFTTATEALKKILRDNHLKFAE